MKRGRFRCGCKEYIIEPNYKSESTLARDSNTQQNPNGTLVGNVVKTLNDNLGNKYDDYSTSTTNFGDKLLNSLRAGYPVICHVKPTALPNYKNQHVPAGHYIIVKGFRLQAGATTQINIQYNDPNWNDKTFGSYTTTIPVMETAINARDKLYVSH